MKTDVKRLQEFWKNNPRDRGCGKTFATCHQLASCVLLNQAKIICYIPKFDWMHHITQMLFEVFEDHNLPLKKI